MTYEQFMIALCIWREARGESVEAKALVYDVIRNRSLSGGKNGWPATMLGVVLQREQFSSFDLGEPNSIAFPHPEAGGDWLAWHDCCAVVLAPGTAAAPNRGVNFYHDVSIAPPFKMWLGKSATLQQLVALQVVKVGKLIFYKV